MMFSETMSLRVLYYFMCTLLHRKLPDYSIGQNSFRCFSSIIFYHTAAFPGKVLLTSGCKQV